MRLCKQASYGKWKAENRESPWDFQGAEEHVKHKSDIDLINCNKELKINRGIDGIQPSMWLKRTYIMMWMQENSDIFGKVSSVNNLLKSLW